MRALALAGVIAVVGVAGTAAQSTPEVGAGSGIMANPTTGTCEAPAGMAAMEADPAASPMASPMASPTGADEVAEAPVPTPIEETATVDAAVAAAENFVFCWNAGEVEAVVGLGTANYLERQYGLASMDDAVAALSMEGALPPITLISTGAVNTYDDGRASLDLEYLLGDHQYTAARWYMVEADGLLRIDEQELRLPQPDVEASSVLGVTFADDDSPIAFDQGADDAGNREVSALPAIILNMKNDGTALRMISVVRLEEGAASPVADTSPVGEFVAQVTLPAGSQDDVALIDLTPGTYAVGETDGGSVLLTVAAAA